MKNPMKYTVLLAVTITIGIVLAFISCKKDEEKKATLPTLTTKTTTVITYNSAISGGFISSDGGAAITERGVCYSTTNQDPTVNDYVITSGEGTGNYQCNLSELDPETDYYVRAYALNAVGVGYGNREEFSTIVDTFTPIADFTALPTIGTRPLYVRFTDQSINNPTSWDWNFGDGNTSTLQNPAHFYENSGTYTVNLTVANNSGYDSESKSSYIVVTPENNGPISDFVASPTMGIAPLTANFTDMSINNPTSWDWNFGDGNTSFQQNPVHIYQNHGVYTIQLITKNEFGSDTIIKNNHLIVNSQGEPISDIDGNIYQTVIIGDQEWMAENLKVIHYRNGDDIPNRIEDYEWNNALEGAYCWYNNDINWKDAYGALYNWLAVTDNRQLCPEGWHISTKLEWTILTDYLGGIDNSGGKLKSMKAAPDNHPRWDSPNTGSTNESGFSGLPGGSRSYYFKFDFIGKYGSWWTSTEQISGYAWSYELSYISIITANGFGVTNSGYSVCCVKD